MALIQCPECGQSISDRAANCPKCGCPIGQNTGAAVADVRQARPLRTVKRKVLIPIIAVCAVLVAVGIYFAVRGSGSVTVKDITISDWRLTDTSYFLDDYKGTVVSEQKKPFVAVIGQYDAEATPRLVYVEDGEGTFETMELQDDDPSIKYQPLGYITGTSVKENAVEFTYKVEDYTDYSTLSSTSCMITLELDMKTKNTGLLVLDIVDKANDTTKENAVVPIVHGKTRYTFYEDIAYKARGAKISIVPKLFCKAKAIAEDDYAVEKVFTVIPDEDDGSYSGEKILSFAGWDDGFVLYTKTLKEGGKKENRDVPTYVSTYLQDGECTLTTYDYSSTGEKILLPQYQFDVAGYMTWKALEED